MNMYSKYLIAQIIVLFLVGSMFGSPGLFIAFVLSVVIFFIVRGVKRIVEEEDNNP